jgi:putative transposase
MELVNNHKEYNKDCNSVYSCQYHVIFCPKYRRKVLDENIAKRLKELILEKQSEYQYKIIEIEIMPDHVHLLIDCNPKLGINNQIAKIKGYTSNTLRLEFPHLKSRLPTLWTRSKFISTVGSVSLEIVKKYIEDQKNV